VRFKLSIMNDKSSLVITKQLVISKQLKLYFNNASRIPTQEEEGECVYAPRSLIFRRFNPET
jgi:hypothetical protein